MKPLPSKEYLHECFTYVDGDLVWKERPREHFRTQGAWFGVIKRTAGKSALTQSNGYFVVSLNGIYAAHRVIYKMFYDDEPLVIDHIDRNKLNNKVENLRASTHTANLSNQLKHHANLPTGIAVEYTSIGAVYKATLCFQNKVFLLGRYRTVNEAVDARNKEIDKVVASLEAIYPTWYASN